MTNPERIYQLLKSVGLSQAAIAGIMGNLYVESGFNPKAYNANEGAIGIAQWEGGRRTALQQFAAAHGTSETDLDTQVAFLLTEAQQRGNLAGVEASTDAGSAAAYWDKNFEVSAGTSRQERVSIAQEVYNAIGGTSYGGSVQSSFGDFKTIPIVDSGSVGDTLKNIFNVPWNLGGDIANMGSSVVDWTVKFGSMLGWLESPDNWWRIGKGILGATLILFAAIKIAGIDDTIKQGAGVVAKAALVA